MRVLSGIQPSGRFHLGNYFGALRQYIDLQEDNEAYYFIANLHALTSTRDRDLLEQLTLDSALDLLALGLDPEKATLFVQSDVPEVTELTWLLSTVTPMGLLERCHAYKDKVQQGLPADHGLFAYPVLMAADILIYDADKIPVGQDQKQHIEVTRDIAGRFNHLYGDVFHLPDAYILENVATVPGIDGMKMSKSRKNILGIFEDPKSLTKKVKRIVTDSRTVEESKDPDTCNVMALLRLVASAEEVAQWEDRYRQGGVGYGDAKKRLAVLLDEHFAPVRTRRSELEKDPDTVRDVLREGGRRAREKAAEVLERARRACGIWTSGRNTKSSDHS